MGARDLLRGDYSSEFELRLHIADRFLNPDYSVFDCGGMALREDELSFSWEVDRSVLGWDEGSSSAAGVEALRKMMGDGGKRRGLPAPGWSCS